MAMRKTLGSNRRMHEPVLAIRPAFIGQHPKDLTGNDAM
jgi:hypothetical protein